MSIMLGNLTVEDMERRSGVAFPEELKAILKDTHQANATNIAKGKWHCFDIPFTLVVGGMAFAQDIYDHLEPLAGNFQQTMEIALAQETP